MVVRVVVGVGCWVVVSSGDGGFGEEHIHRRIETDGYKIQTKTRQICEMIRSQI